MVGDVNSCEMEFIKKLYEKLFPDDSLALVRLFRSHTYTLWILHRVLENIDIVIVIMKFVYQLQSWSFYSGKNQTILNVEGCNYGYGVCCDYLSGTMMPSVPTAWVSVLLPQYKYLTSSISALFVVDHKGDVHGFDGTHGLHATQHIYFKEFMSCNNIKKVVCVVNTLVYF